MAKRKRSWTGWKPNIQPGPLTGGTAYQTPSSGSFTPLPSTPPSVAPAAPAPTQSAAPVVNMKDAQWGLDTGGVLNQAGVTATEYGASAPNVQYVDENGKPTTPDNPNAKPTIAGGLQVDWSNPDQLAKNNPFSRAALLIRSYQQGVQGTSNSYASRGQHSSGAYQRAQGSNAFGFEQGKSGINSALANFFTGANQGLAQASINAKGRWDATPQKTIPGSQVGATGTWTYGNQAAQGAPSANQILQEWGQRPDASGNAPSGLNGTVKLANGWTMVYVNGKPKFIPPGGRA